MLSTHSANQKIERSGPFPASMSQILETGISPKFWFKIDLSVDFLSNIKTSS